MHWPDFLLNPIRLLELPADMQREARLRRVAAESQDGDIADLAEQNAQLRLLLSAVVALLGERGILRPEDLRRKVNELAQPPASPADENPFAGLER